MFPSKMVCLARNYSEHVAELSKIGGVPVDVPKTPAIFLKPPSSLIGHGGFVLLPPQSNMVHHEVELAVVIGTKARNVSAEEAFSYIYGYTIIIDVTARDLQLKAQREGFGSGVAKIFDTFAPVYYVVPKDRIPDPHALKIGLKVNNQLRQSSDTGKMIFKIPRLIEYISSVMTLERGDLVATGTPEGVGPLEDGDIVEAMVERIGVLNVTAKRSGQG